MTDPKAAEREALAETWLRSIPPTYDLAFERRRLAEMLATRERDAAVGALREVRIILLQLHRLNDWEEFAGDGRVMDAALVKGYSEAALMAIEARLALEQGTPATCASCGTSMEGERFTVQASVRADLVGKTVGRCCWPPDHGAEGTPATCPTCKRPMVDPARAHDATDAEAAPLCFAAVGSRGAQEECRRYAPGTPATREETP